LLAAQALRDRDMPDLAFALELRAEERKRFISETHAARCSLGLEQPALDKAA
jgi:hypothetical protein